MLFHHHDHERVGDGGESTQNHVDGSIGEGDDWVGGICWQGKVKLR